MTRVYGALIGIAMGFTLSRSGFSNPDAVNAMFTLSEVRLLLTFATAVSLLVVGFRLMPRHLTSRLAKRRQQRGTVLGGLMFGTGWALCGACPSIALVQIGEGQWWAVLTLCGMFAGNLGFALLDRHVLRWRQGGCNG